MLTRAGFNKLYICKTSSINKFYETLEKFIHWICKRFSIPEENELIRDFQEETRTFIDPEKQINREEKDYEIEL